MGRVSGSSIPLALKSRQPAFKVQKPIDRSKLAKSQAYLVERNKARGPIFGNELFSVFQNFRPGLGPVAATWSSRESLRSFDPSPSRKKNGHWETKSARFALELYKFCLSIISRYKAQILQHLHDSSVLHGLRQYTCSAEL